MVPPCFRSSVFSVFSSPLYQVFNNRAHRIGMSDATLDTLIISDLHLGSELSRAREALDLLQSDLFEQKDYRFCRMRELLMQARPTAQWDTSLKLSKTECARYHKISYSAEKIDHLLATNSNEVVFCQFCEILFVCKLINLIKKFVSIDSAHSRCSSPEFDGVKPYADRMFGVHALHLRAW